MRSPLATSRHRLALRRQLTRQHHHAVLAARRRAPRLVGLLLVGALVAACGNAAGAAAPSDVEAPVVEAPADPLEEPGDPEPEMPGDAEAPVDPDGDGEGDAATGVLGLGFDERNLWVTDPDGTESFGWEPDAVRGETFHHVAVRPGGTATTLDAVVTVLRGEVPYLYALTIRDGRDATFSDVPAHLQPQDVTESVIAPRFTPDGRSVIWTEPTGDGVVLRTFGWDAGAGTGRTADDNATFALDLPADVTVVGFDVAGDLDDPLGAAAWDVVLEDGLGKVHVIGMERQTDGALALTGR